jgi:hypothetical protein
MGKWMDDLYDMYEMIMGYDTTDGVLIVYCARAE